MANGTSVNLHNLNLGRAGNQPPLPPPPTPPCGTKRIWYWPAPTATAAATPTACGGAVPPKVDEAFRLGNYVPYTSLTKAARHKALFEKSNALKLDTVNGSLVVDDTLDRGKERFISLQDWSVAAGVAEERTRMAFLGQGGVSGQAPHGCWGTRGRLSRSTTSVSGSYGPGFDLLLTLSTPVSQPMIFLRRGVASKRLILSLPPGCVAAASDVSAAYRITPVRPDQQNCLCVFWDGYVYVDRASRLVLA
ncbi:hypothetical protein CC1G_01470 [Coprinopsis cinerea okayama7|uniref:Uncharacterized protein n=1 Tax=Coprinopsis cinerea (strain Okayama-7 / 130 / ATCC MYA-4618 / FGSC 9003) TaxID=240176 RepID=A8NYY4_COPC7|nr:hypothetical protein CC1G_01470 [Coprinopsis cinerea okayama7\|eukprot:XP_001837558.2 hypothetical protein CC1G_01470 [Coprinopsis cinerea okayama7\